MTTVKAKQNSITHVAFVIDASSSMNGMQGNVISVFDGQIAWLARRSQELKHECRVSVYFFSYAHAIECAIYDMDVLRLPSIRNLYQPYGNTALRDATLKSQEDLAKTYMEYGDHTFLTFVITDGEENASSRPIGDLQRLLGSQDDQWTVAALVPNVRGRLSAEAAGFPRGNIEIWDTNSATGIAEAGEKIQKATDTYLVTRSTGLRPNTSTLFAGSAQQVNTQTVKAAGLTPLDPDKFFLFPAVPSDMAPTVISGVRTRKRKDGSIQTTEGIKCVEISAMVRSTGRQYVLGNGFYELVKSEKISGNKRIAVVERATSKVFLGKAARQLIGLGDHDVRVKPMPKDSSGLPPFKIFVESQSINRHLPIGSQVLYLK